MKHQFTENVNGPLTVMRFGARTVSHSAADATTDFQGAAQRRQHRAVAAAADLPVLKMPSTIRVQMPHVGTRFAYMGTGDQAGFMVALNAAFRHYRSAPTAGGIPSGQDINSYLVGAELAVPITNRLKFTGEIAYGQALGVEFFRFGQERNLGTGKAIRTVVGWGELDYAYDRQLTLIAGYGFDNPLNSDPTAQPPVQIHNTY